MGIFNMIKIIYFGYSITMLNKLIASSYFEVVAVVTQKGKYTDVFKKACESLIFYEVEKSEEIDKLYDVIKNYNVVMYEFGILLSSKLCNNLSIINFHCGDLKTNRGANPISWSILLPNLGAEICAYEIYDKFDCGKIISKKSIMVSDDDTVDMLKYKLELEIDDILLDIYNYFKDSNKCTYENVLNGIYRSRVQEKDYTIDLSKDNLCVIKRKINSQKNYNGAILFYKNKKIRVKNYKEENKKFFLVCDDEFELEIEL
jgi:methionyl-tRNA formyltransferase